MINTEKLHNVFGHRISLDYINNKSIIIDAGACIGNFVKNLRKLDCNPRIVCIEPSNSNIIELNKINDITIIRACLVGRKTDKINFIEIPSLPEWGSIYKKNSLHAREKPNISYDVETITIEELLRTYPVIDYLKMDIESEEFNVIETLNINDNIKQMSLEVHEGNTNHIIEILKSLGYECETFEPNELYASKLS